MLVPEEKADDLDIAVSPSLPLNGARGSGSIEVLKPLAGPEALSQGEAGSGLPRFDELSWFHLSLVIGGAVVAAAVILSGVFIWIEAHGVHAGGGGGGIK